MLISGSPRKLLSKSCRNNEVTLITQGRQLLKARRVLHSARLVLGVARLYRPRSSMSRTAYARFRCLGEINHTVIVADMAVVGRVFKECSILCYGLCCCYCRNSPRATTSRHFHMPLRFCRKPSASSVHRLQTSMTSSSVFIAIHHDLLYCHQSYLLLHNHVDTSKAHREADSSDLKMHSRGP